MQKLEAVGWIERTGGEILIKHCEIEPEVLYIQPFNKANRSNVICFDDIISVLSEMDDPIAERFALSLEKWKVDTNSK